MHINRLIAYHRRLLGRLALCLTIPIALTGCVTVGPSYQPPDSNSATPAAWHGPLDSGLTAGATDPNTLAVWWTTLNDPQLNTLIQRAVTGNYDLKNALLRVNEARARRGQAGAGLYPTVDLSSAATWTRADDQTRDSYSAGLTASWELDMFGRVRRTLEAYDADIQVRREALHDVLLSLVAEVALNYIDVRMLQARIESTESGYALQEETYQLTCWQAQAGLNDELDTHQALYSLKTTQAQIPALHTSLDQALNRLAILLGEQPGALHDELTGTQPIPAIPASVNVGVPLDAIRRRPDIRQAERELAAQSARVGVATADLYPRFTLNGSIGMDGDSLDALARNVTTPDNWTVSGGPQLRWNLFNAGAVRNNIKIQSLLQEQALNQYETTVLTALEEVENSLVAYRQEQQRLNYLTEATVAAGQAAELAQFEYQAGLIGFNTVLEAQRSLLSLQDQSVQSRATVTSNLVRLYKVLGGGWPAGQGDHSQS